MSVVYHGGGPLHGVDHETGVIREGDTIGSAIRRQLSWVRLHLVQLETETARVLHRSRNDAIDDAIKSAKLNIGGAVDLIDLLTLEIDGREPLTDEVEQ